MLEYDTLICDNLNRVHLDSDFKVIHNCEHVFEYPPEKDCLRRTFFRARRTTNGGGLPTGGARRRLVTGGGLPMGGGLRNCCRLSTSLSTKKRHFFVEDTQWRCNSLEGTEFNVLLIERAQPVGLE